MINQNITKSIKKASELIGKTWPLYSFVTSNPLSGFEKTSFQSAVVEANRLFGANIFPNGSQYLQALKKGEINEAILSNFLLENEFNESVEYYLNEIESHTKLFTKNKNHDLDRIMVKWLSCFLDEGIAEWKMPFKSEGFYSSWRKLAVYDNEIKVKSLNELPVTSEDALEVLLKNYSQEECSKIFSYHFTALPGWVGYIKYRLETNSLWNQKYPITLEDYLAVRLSIAKSLDVQIFPSEENLVKNERLIKLQYIFLKAWEKSFQEELSTLLKNESKDQKSSHSKETLPDAQMVFCIDTRSELIRRHIESKGNYETFGYAGFFGIAMDYEHMHSGIVSKSCPPILPSSYEVYETPKENHDHEYTNNKKKADYLKFSKYFLRRMKNILPSAFGFVEGSGIFYGLSMVWRTMLPNSMSTFKSKTSLNYESICNPEIQYKLEVQNGTLNIPLDDKVSIVKSAFDLMGWENFAPLVLFIGHGSHTSNNPFGSSLDCGACAASPGRNNARMLASLANLPEVRESLEQKYGLTIPDQTVFIGAEHNTTTNEIVLFDSGVPEHSKERLNKLKLDFELAKNTANQEMLNSVSKGTTLANKKSFNWSETRPEWGLAKNAAFIIGPRAITKNHHLDGRCFLHSYDWKKDEKGTALEGIMQGPMVVTQWINNHYYFSTVDNDLFGGGDKITHNITGKFGVLQGNGSDLKAGLPFQSLFQSTKEMYHSPLRLSVLIQAPMERIQNILSKNQNIKDLLDNEWIYLMVMDPLKNNQITYYNNIITINPSEEFDANFKKNINIKNQEVENSNQVLV